MSERIKLTPRQIELLAPQVRRVTVLRQQAVQLEEALQEANAQLVRECEMVYPAFNPKEGHRFIASEGVIELPVATAKATVVSRNTGKYRDANDSIPTDSEGPE